MLRFVILIKNSETIFHIQACLFIFWPCNKLKIAYFSILSINKNYAGNYLATVFKLITL